MANEVKLSSFPSTAREAVAIEYLKQQDISGKTPAEAYDMYLAVCKEIDERDSQLLGEQMHNFTF